MRPISIRNTSTLYCYRSPWIIWVNLCMCLWAMWTATTTPMFYIVQIFLTSLMPESECQGTPLWQNNGWQSRHSSWMILPILCEHGSWQQMEEAVWMQRRLISTMSVIAHTLWWSKHLVGWRDAGSVFWRNYMLWRKTLYVICSCIILHNMCESRVFPPNFGELGPHHAPIPRQHYSPHDRQQRDKEAVRNVLTTWLFRQRHWMSY